jgi:hypothetical protein
MNIARSRSPRTLALVGLVVLGAFKPAGGLTPRARAEDTPAPAVAFASRDDGLAITVGGKPLAVYVFEDGPTTRPFLKDLHAPDGTRVTRNHPPVEGVDRTDHGTMHPGLWMAFGDLGGADFWRNRDRVRHVDFAEPPRGGAGSGAFAVRNRYEKGGQPIAEELCRITVVAGPDRHLLLWDSTFRPIGPELVFGDQEEMGLGVRMATPLTVARGGRLVNSDGLVNEAQVWGKAADWCAFEGPVGGRTVGVALLPHPGNFRPSWFHARDYGLLVANPFGANAMTRGPKSRFVVRAESPLRLRFGVAVYSDPASDHDLAAAHRDYLKAAGASPE